MNETLKLIFDHSIETCFILLALAAVIRAFGWAMKDIVGRGTTQEIVEDDDDD